ncbi:hypothetical protein V8E36_004669 [Tilletia maclaganii]
MDTTAAPAPGPPGAPAPAPAQNRPPDPPRPPATDFGVAPMDFETSSSERRTSHKRARVSSELSESADDISLPKDTGNSAKTHPWPSATPGRPRSASVGSDRPATSAGEGSIATAISPSTERSSDTETTAKDSSPSAAVDRSLRASAHAPPPAGANSGPVATAAREVVNDATKNNPPSQVRPSPAPAPESTDALLQAAADRAVAVGAVKSRLLTGFLQPLREAESLDAVDPAVARLLRASALAASRATSLTDVERDELNEVSASLETWLTPAWTPPATRRDTAAIRTDPGPSSPPSATTAAATTGHQPTAAQTAALSA